MTVSKLLLITLVLAIASGSQLRTRTSTSTTGVCAGDGELCNFDYPCCEGKCVPADGLSADVATCYFDVMYADWAYDERAWAVANPEEWRMS